MAAVTFPAPAIPIRRRSPLRNLIAPSDPSTSGRIPVPECSRISATEFSLSKFHSPGSDAYAAAIESCNCLRLGKQIHAHAAKNAYSGSPDFLNTKLISMYSRCGWFEGARDLFDEMPVRSLHSWRSVITACVDHGFLEEGVFLFLEFLEEDIDLEFFIFPGVLRAAGGLSDLELGKQVHGFVVKLGFISSIYVSNALIHMYGKCRSPDDAESVLILMPERDLVSWNSMITALVASNMVFEALEILRWMQDEKNPAPNLITWGAVISGFAQNDSEIKSLDLFREMMHSGGIQPNAQVLSSVLPCCGKQRFLSSGREIHGYAIKFKFLSNSFIINGLIDVYRKCHDMDSAVKILCRSNPGNTTSLNSILSGYFDVGEADKARNLLQEIEFQGVPIDSTSWNAIISGYAAGKNPSKAFKIFSDMQFKDLVVDSSTISILVSICARTCDLKRGMQLHSFIVSHSLSSDLHVNGALVEMYSRCGDLISAKNIFDREKSTDQSIWNTMISAYVRSDQMNEARILLVEMQNEGFEITTHTWNGILSGFLERESYESVFTVVDEMQERGIMHDVYTMGILLLACSRLGRIEKGKQIHGILIRSCWDSDTHLGSSLVDMYAKCGKIHHAEKVFERIDIYNLVAYNSMISGFAAHGLGEKVNWMFDQIRSKGWDPDEVTFLSVLSSCAHEGDIDRCMEYFTLMEKLKVKADVRHYSCVVDLLSRAGLVAEAFRLAQEMPFEADAITWGTILRGSVLHGLTEIGEVVAKELMKLEGNAGNYIVSGKLYGHMKRVEGFREMREKGFKKSSGCSWIEDGNGRAHVFLAGDTSHEDTGEIYESLRRLNSHMRNNRGIDVLLHE